MGYLIDVDHENCINCGICMDVCPVQALDMQRPTRDGVEGDGPNPWLMEAPIQVGECIGCSICIRECPVEVMTLERVPGPTILANRQGPIAAAPPLTGWVPLSAVTREALKPDHPSPFSPYHAWRTRERPESWQVWTTMVDPALPPPQAPCQTACPAGTDAGRYVSLIGQGRFDDAYAVAAEVNPFPSVCGWICTAPCEAACRRGTLDEPIAIRTLKRFAAEHGHLPPVPAPTTHRTARVAIVGGGPAGMSAAWYLARLGYEVVVFEAMPVVGGMMAIGIPEYRLPREALQQDLQRILDLGVDLRLDTAMGRDFTLDDLQRQGFAAVFLATGASRSRRLDVPGEGLPGVVPATLFLKQVNLGEQPQLSGPVVVVGGGSTAMDAARSAWRSGAGSVTILYRRGRADMPAQVEEIEAAEREGIVIRPATGVVEIGAQNGRTAWVRIIDRGIAAAPAGGPAEYEDVPGSDATVAAATVLVAVGEEPDPSILPEGAGIGLTAFAGIDADSRSLRTTRAGVFAGGDVVAGAKTVIDAVAAGRRAAGSIHEHLAGVRDGESEIMAAVRYPRPVETLLTVDLAARPRERVGAGTASKGSFEATQPGFEEAAARREAGRCFRCDSVYSCPTVSVLAGRRPASAAGGHPPDPVPTPARGAPASVSEATGSTGTGGWLTAVPIPAAVTGSRQPHTTNGGSR